MHNSTQMKMFRNCILFVNKKEDVLTGNNCFIIHAQSTLINMRALNYASMRDLREIFRIMSFPIIIFIPFLIRTTAKRVRLKIKNKK